MRSTDSNFIARCTNVRKSVTVAKAYKIRKSLNLFTNIQGEFSDSIADEIDLENYV